MLAKPRKIRNIEVDSSSDSDHEDSSNIDTTMAEVLGILVCLLFSDSSHPHYSRGERGERGERE
jgi:hypothetical protein